MTNEELFEQLRVEIGWLRNELNFMRSAYEQQGRQLEDVRRTVQRLEQAASGWAPMVR
jgi:hypothetical protein